MALLNDLIKTGTTVPVSEDFPLAEGLALVVKAGEESVYLKNDAGVMVKVTTNQSAIDSIIGTKANKTDVLELDNTSAYTPTTQYHPATKKYVDSTIDTKANKTNVLELDNTSAYTPTTQYHPATKKYVDELSVDAYTVSETDSLLAGKLGVDATAHNSNLLDNSSKATIISEAVAAVPSSGWEYVTDPANLGAVNDGFAEYGVSDFITNLPSAAMGNPVEFLIEFEIQQSGSTGVMPGFKLDDGGFFTWAGNQPIGTDLTTYSGFTSISILSNKAGDITKVTWDDGTVHTTKKYLLSKTMTFNYSCKLYLYNTFDHKSDLSSNVRIVINSIKYRTA